MAQHLINHRLVGQYSDEHICGPRKQALEIESLIKLRSRTECIFHPIGTFTNKIEASIKRFLVGDRRIKQLFENLPIEHGLPIQRYSWPLIENQAFPLVLVSHRGTGKTYSHLLYIVTQCIKQTAARATDEIIQSTTDDSAIKDSAIIDNFKGLKLKEEIELNQVEIDQDNFDFNSLGRISENGTTQTSTNGFSTEPDEEEDQEIRLDLGPKYVIICSSQQQVKFLQTDIDRMKEAAYGNQASYKLRKEKLPPLVRTLSTYHEDDKLAIRCAEGEILICTPTILLKCIKNGYIYFSQCTRVIYDDIDQSLQLHNSNVRELMKAYVAESLEVVEDSQDKFPQIIFCAQKWTELVKQLLCNVFQQKNLLFGSILEASIYMNMSFELERNQDPFVQMTKMVTIINLERASLPAASKIVVICNTDNQAKQVTNYLEKLKCQVKYLTEKTALIEFKKYNDLKIRDIKQRSITDVFVISDAGLEILFEAIPDAARIIHCSIPNNMLAFDSRFRLMYKYINESQDEMKSLKTYIFLSHKFDSLKMAQELYDLMTRSSTTLNSTKLEMRDLLEDLATDVCWRWATAGTCRLYKFGRESCVGSFCSDRHSTRPNGVKSKRWFGQAEVKITITHIVSPNEFYFWLEEFRKDEPRWTRYDMSGIDYMNKFQRILDQYKEPNAKVPLGQIKKGCIFGVYFQELARVDRVVLLENPKNPDIFSNFDELCSYSNQCKTFKIDYGVEVSVYLRNLINLPKNLASHEWMAHRGFLIGLKPADNEPHWNYKATKLFHEKIFQDHLQEATLWMRYNEETCFWFESFNLARKLYNHDGTKNKTVTKCNLLKELRSSEYAEQTPEPSYLEASERSACLSKWHTDLTQKLASFAFLRKDKSQLDVFVLHVRQDLTLVVRQYDFNQLLINLENDLMQEYKNDCLTKLDFYEPGVLCLARIAVDQVTTTINRCKIINGMSNDTNPKQTCFKVYCLDHGDYFVVSPNDLYLCPHELTSRLPYQSIEVRISSYNALLDEKPDLMKRVIESIYDLTRYPDDNLRKCKAILDGQGDIYLYVTQDSGKNRIYRPLNKILFDMHGVYLSNPAEIPDELNNDLTEIHDDDPDENAFPDLRDAIFKCLVKHLLHDIISDELKRVQSS